MSQFTAGLKLSIMDKLFGRNQNAEQWYKKGNALGLAGKPRKAILYFEKALSLNPNCKEAWNDKARAFLASLVLGDFPGGIMVTTSVLVEEALYCIEKAIELDPKFAEAWVNKGNALALRKEGKDLKIALECFEKALRFDPQNKEARYCKEMMLKQLS